MSFVTATVSRPGDPFNPLAPEVAEEILRDALLQMGWQPNFRSPTFLVSPDGRYEVHLRIQASPS